MKREHVVLTVACLATASVAFGLGFAWNGHANSAVEAYQPQSAESIAVSNYRPPQHASVRQDVGLEVGNLLGLQIAYVEARTGPAREVFEDLRVYEVDGCDITLTAKDSEVKGVRVPMTPACSTAARSLLLSRGIPATMPLTFGAYAAAVGGAKFGADCLYLCGNAADPTVFMIGGGSHADGWVMTRAIAVQVDDATLKAADTIEDAVRLGSGEDYLLSTRFNCDPTYDAVALSALRDVAIGEIEVGYDLNADFC